jgi:hypothetical protein
MLAALLAGDAAAQHPVLGADRPAPDPRHRSPREMHTSIGRVVEMFWDFGDERCVFRVYGWRGGDKPYLVDAWALGIVKDGRRATAFFETRVSDRNGNALEIERPTLYLVFTGPTKDWRVLPMRADGYVRTEKPLRDMSEDEREGFWQATEDRRLRELAFTLPQGGGDSYVALIDGATDRQYEAFANCICATLEGAERRLFRCG